MTCKHRYVARNGMVACGRCGTKRAATEEEAGLTVGRRPMEALGATYVAVREVKYGELPPILGLVVLIMLGSTLLFVSDGDAVGLITIILASLSFFVAVCIWWGLASMRYTREEAAAQWLLGVVQDEPPKPEPPAKRDPAGCDHDYMMPYPGRATLVCAKCGAPHGASGFRPPDSARKFYGWKEGKTSMNPLAAAFTAFGMVTILLMFLLYMIGSTTMGGERIIHINPLAFVVLAAFSATYILTGVVGDRKFPDWRRVPPGRQPPTKSTFSTGRAGARRPS